jgi:AraC-like DNA-binding protein
MLKSELILDPLSVRAGALTGFATLVSRHGGSPDDLLVAAGIAPKALDNPQNPLPLNKVAGLLHHAAEALTVPDFGLQLAEYQDISVLGAVAMIVMNCATIAEALDGIAKNMAYHTPGGKLVVEADERDGYVRVSYDLELDNDAERRQAVELSYTVLYQFLCLAASTTGMNWEIRFRHKRELTLARYRKYLACAVKFGQPFDALSLPVELMSTPINQANPELKATAERFVRHVVRRNPLDIGGQVVALAEQQLASGGANIKHIARMLGMHPRTLQRRLEGRGLYFEDLIDKLRQERAAYFLKQAALPILQVTFMLGYSGQNAFTAACRRWFGLPPLKYRNQCLTGKASC